jgi:DNA-directed RNA polymerase subunit beta'
VENCQEAYPGDSGGPIPRATTKAKDVTGGLPRVVELFEARHPRDKAVITEFDGTVHRGPALKGVRRIISEDEGTRHEYSEPRSVHVNVQEGERVRAGDPLNAMLAAARRVRSNRTTFCRPRYQGAAALPGRQDPGGLPLAVRRHQRQAHRSHLPPDVAVGPRHASRRYRLPYRRAGQSFRFMEENEKVMNRGGEPADGTPRLLGLGLTSLRTASSPPHPAMRPRACRQNHPFAARVDIPDRLKKHVIVGARPLRHPPAHAHEFCRERRTRPQPTLDDRRSS